MSARCDSFEALFAVLDNDHTNTTPNTNTDTNGNSDGAAELRRLEDVMSEVGIVHQRHFRSLVTRKRDVICGLIVS